MILASLLLKSASCIGVAVRPRWSVITRIPLRIHLFCKLSAIALRHALWQHTVRLGPSPGAVNQDGGELSSLRVQMPQKWPDALSILQIDWKTNNILNVGLP